jgi:VTC domain
MLRDSADPGAAATPKWQAMLGGFETVGLDRIAKLATDHRIDTKFLLREETAFDMLGELPGHYRVLDVDGRRFTTYRTQYFDTPSLELYRRHHTGSANRYKVRSRVYLNTELAFVEIKRKSGRGVTTKVRRPTEHFETRLLPGSKDFIDGNCSVDANALMPSLLNRFDRICLVSEATPERFTIDLGLQFDSESGPVRLPGVVVAELKQQRNGHNFRDAVILNRMRAMGMRPSGFSKYCMGLLLTRRGIKHNLLKPQLKRLERLMEERNVVC